METAAVNRETIAATYELIRPHVRRTPVIEVDAADFALEGRPIAFKLELLQHTGSFKPRGALASLLSRRGSAGGGGAGSAGHHRRALAVAAPNTGGAAREF